MASRSPSRFFPPAQQADAHGLVAVGGQLEPEWILDAYRHGIFPWPVLPDPSQLAWWSPDPRAIIELDSFHVSRRLARTMRAGRFRVTVNTAFARVIDACATVGDRRGNSWITPAMQRAYCRLHTLGWVHSIECWEEGSLAGGVYGVAVGGMFAGESMFHRTSGASTVALAHLVERLRQRRYVLLDIQQLTPHTLRLGAREIPRQHYLSRLAEAVELPCVFL